MGAWLYYCDVDGNGKVNVNMNVTYNIGELCSKCGLVPWDICIKKMSGIEALPLLKKALKNLNAMSETEIWLDNVRTKLIYAQGTIDYLREYMHKENDEAARVSYEKAKLSFIKQLGEITVPVPGVTRHNVSQIYETMISWIQNDPTGHFEIGSH